MRREIYLGSPGVESGMRGQQARLAQMCLGKMSIDAEYLSPHNSEVQQYNVVHRQMVSVAASCALDNGQPGRLNSFGVAGQAVS